jgi:membrane-bound lytic murein transglycosylase F
MRKLLYLLLFLLAGFACKNKPIREIVAHDLPQIKDSGELVVLTLYSSISYFNYRGEEMGFQYELSKQFAKSLGVKLRIEVANSIPQMINMLLTGEGDLIAYHLPVTKARKDVLLFCGEDVITHQVLVQPSGRNALKDVTGLINKDIYVKPGKYYNRLVNLNDELGGGIRIHKVESDSITSEDLIAQVSQGKIPYTVSDNDVALLNKTYYPNLNIDLPVSYDQRASWAVRRDCPELAKVANVWHKQNRTSPEYTASMKRYFEVSKAIPYAAILSLKDGKISHYDDLFRKYVKEIDWDWRLIAALAYTESNFDTTVVSWAGAQGLMQLMPNTAKAMGVPPGMEHNPEESIKAAVKYIGITDRNLRMISDKHERIHFILGAYNAGLGHIYDAMALTEKYGKNKYVWFDNVEKYILLKSNEEYFNDPVCKYGYFRGRETYAFVRVIHQRFDTYKAKISP